MNGQTAIVQEIDGLQIVTGFGRRSIEPQQTRAVVAGLIEDTDEHRSVVAKQAECKVKLAEAGAAFEAAAAARSEALQRQAMAIYNQGQALVSELAGLIPALKAKTQALMVEHAVYFEPTAYEHPQSDTQIEALRAKMGGAHRVALDGQEIEDNRGVVACTERDGVWAVRRILTLGEKLPAGGILLEELDAGQRAAVELQIERDLVARMSGVEKAAAREQAESKALAASVGMRSGLEIKIDPDDSEALAGALVDARAMYDARMVEIAGIYAGA